MGSRDHHVTQLKGCHTKEDMNQKFKIASYALPSNIRGKRISNACTLG
jgi:hypothetical protein